MLNRILALSLGALAALPALAAAAPAGSSPGMTPAVTLEQIMADRDWLGNPPVEGYWSQDSKSVLYYQKRDGSQLEDLYQVSVDGGDAKKLSDADLANAPGRDGNFNRDHSQQVFVRDNNVFVRSVLTSRLRQLTRDNQKKNAASFMADGGRVQWHQGNDIYVYDLGSGMSGLAAD
ncbi:MAG TPA: S9 family peptidase, partial [Gammaproteobacteria bacterium]